MHNRRSPTLVALLCVALLQAACSPQPRVKVTPPPKAPPQRTASPAPAPLPREGMYVVAAGDTLYGIAFRHGLDYRDVAARNGIAAPYTIYPGQRLQLRDAPPTRTADAPARAMEPVRTPPRATGVVASTVEKPPVPPADQSAAPSAQAAADPKAPTTSVATSITPATPNVSAAPTAPPSPPPTVEATKPAALPTGPLKWQWPTAGKIVGSFQAGDPGRQGINIAGSTGQPVQAAADGVVVYSGSGLIGYGELVIVKHSDVLLSAYGHNRKRMVEEGQAVKAGEQIAEMGRSGASRDMLHFEIRRNGKPIDPLTLLPKR